MKVFTCLVKGQEVLWKFIWIKMPQQTVKAYLKEWGSMSTMHGIPWLVSARTGRARIFWTLVCILAMMMFIYMLVSLVLKYYQYPVVVKVDQVSMLPWARRDVFKGYTLGIKGFSWLRKLRFKKLLGSQMPIHSVKKVSLNFLKLNFTERGETIFEKLPN